MNEPPARPWKPTNRGAAPTDGLRIAVYGMGGSVAETLGHVLRGLHEHGVSTDATLIDLQAFHLRAPGRMTAPQGARLVRLTPRDVGYATPTRSMTLNLALSGGKVAYRRMTRVAGRQLAALAPDVLLCCHDRFYVETAFLAAARHQGIPTVLLQEGPFCVIGHGRANTPALRLKNALAPAARALGLAPGMPDYGTAGHTCILAASSRYRDAWAARDVPAGRIRVTGVPRYDGLVTARRRREAHKSATVPDGQRMPVIMVLIQPFGAHGKVAARAAEAALRTVGEALAAIMRTRAVDVRVRQHPRSEPADAAPLTAALDAGYTLENAATPFAERAAGIDLAVGFYSSAMLEALAVGVPCTGLHVPPQAFAEPAEAAKQTRLAEMGVPLARGRDDLRMQMERLLDSPDSAPDPGAASAELGPLDGRAAARTAAALLAVCARSEEPAAPGGDREHAA